MRALRLTVALAVAVLAGVAGASAVLGQEGQDPVAGPAAVQPDGTGAAIAATTGDPAGDGRVWAVRLYRSQAGLTCPEPGRVVEEDFGRVDGDRSFHPLAPGGTSACVDLARAPYSLAVAHYPADDDRGARDVVFGAVAAQVRAIRLSTPAGAATGVPIAAGAYVAVLASDETGDATVAVALADGSTETHALRAPGP